MWLLLPPSVPGFALQNIFLPSRRHPLPQVWNQGTVTWFSCGSQREGQPKHDSFQLIRRNVHPLNEERTLCIASQSEPPPRCLPRVSRTPTRAPRAPARQFRCPQAIPRFGEPHGTSRPNLFPPSAGAQEKNHGGTPRSRYRPPPPPAPALPEHVVRNDVHQL